MDTPNFFHDTKAALGTAILTIGAGLISGISFTLGWLSFEKIENLLVILGVISTTLGIILTIILIYNHFRSKDLKQRYKEIKIQVDRAEKIQRELLLATARNEALTEILGDIAKNNSEKLRVLKL